MFVKVVVNLRVKGRYEKACEHFLYMVYWKDLKFSGRGDPKNC
jgi:hypothetical protein